MDTVAGKAIDEKIHYPQGGTMRDENDHARLRQGITQHEGFDVGKYVHPSPMFFTRTGNPLWLQDFYRGWAAFLVCGGPSLLTTDLSKIQAPGILTMGINNSVRTFRPNLWCSVDDPGNFIKSIWLDPTITKFVPFCHAEKKIWDNESWRPGKFKVGDCPGVVHYRRNESFRYEQYLFEDTINWGNHSDLCACGYKRPSVKKKKMKICPECGEKKWGSRSVMLAAVRIMFLLGVRRLFLVGADFKMEAGKQNYGFSQERSEQSIKNNNATYARLNERFDLLRPVFEKNEFMIYNCNLDSGLKSFPYAPYDEAVKFALSNMPDVANERSGGLYERKALEKKAKEPADTLTEFLKRRGA